MTRNTLKRLGLMAACIPLLLPVSASAQQTLTLEKALRIAFENSYQARVAREQLRASEASAEASRKALYSTVDLNFEAPSYDSRLKQQFNSVTRRDEYFRVENLRWFGGVSINQPLIWTNSTITLSGQMYRLDQKDASAGSFFRNYYGDLVVRLEQPLFVPNSQRIALRRAELEYEEAKSDYRRATLDLLYTVTESFYRGYSSQEQLAIQSDRVKQQEESYTTAMRKYRAGLIAEVDALQFEVDLAAARNDLLTAGNTHSGRMNNFKLLIGLPLADSLLLTLTDTSFVPVQIDPARAIGEAKRTRVDLQRARNNVERSTLSLDEIDGQRSIRGDISVNYGLNDAADKVRSLFLSPTESRGATLRITVPVFDWGKHGRDVEAAEARLRSAQYTAENTELTIEQEITDLVRRIGSAAERVNVLFKSRLVAEKANGINTSRYEVGTIGSLELSQSQTRLLQARLSALEAWIDYNVALADLARRTAFDFSTGSEVEPPR